MITKTNISRIFSLSLAVAVLFLVSGYLTSVSAQRDPFKKAPFATPRVPGMPKLGKDGKPIQEWVGGVPPIEQRIEYYKRLRESAAVNGSSIPKVTTVLTLNEMSVIGIFKTPRGYAAMVEANPIKLSYTIYPGEKFFDGQLVAVEENRLVFRKVTKTGPGKFVSTVETKALRKYTTQQEIEGTAPAGSSDSSSETASSARPAGSEQKVMPSVIISPLDEMNKPAPAQEKKSSKAGSKPVKVARKR
jgi:hypothetical protein